MKSTEKIWHDENSEPPKNYIWAKNGKLFKYINGQWKEISKNNSGCDCPGAMFVHGMIAEINGQFAFTQNDGEPSSAAAKSHIEKGGTLYIVFSPSDGIELTVPLTIIQTVNGTTLLGFMVNADHIASWQYEPDPDFSIRVDYNNPDISNAELTKVWSTQLDESTVGGAETCKLFIERSIYDIDNVILSKVADGVFASAKGAEMWGLASREYALNEDSSLAIPETVKYVVVRRGTLS